MSERIFDESKDHRCSFTNDAFEVTLEARGVSQQLWARLVAGVMTEIQKPDMALTFPEALTEEEAETVRRRWTEKYGRA